MGSLQTSYYLQSFPYDSQNVAIDIVTMATTHSRCYFSITIHGMMLLYMHLQVFLAYVQNTAHKKIKD